METKMQGDDQHMEFKSMQRKVWKLAQLPKRVSVSAAELLDKMGSRRTAPPPKLQGSCFLPVKQMKSKLCSAQIFVYPCVSIKLSIEHQSSKNKGKNKCRQYSRFTIYFK
jgi:hypothetical protein